MYFIDEEHKQVTAGSATVTIKRPRAGAILRFISLVNSGVEGRFAKGYGRLANAAGKEHRGLYNKIIVNPSVPVLLWEGYVPWRLGTQLRLTLRTQTANDILFYVVGYTLLDEEKPGQPKPWPGWPGWG